MSTSIACSRTAASRRRTVPGLKMTLRRRSPGWSGAASIMLSITGIRAKALVIWNVRTMPRRAIAYDGRPSTRLPSKAALPPSGR